MFFRGDIYVRIETYRGRSKILSSKSSDRRVEEEEEERRERYSHICIYISPHTSMENQPFFLEAKNIIAPTPHTITINPTKY